MLHVLILSTLLAVSGATPPPPAHHHHRSYHAPSEANDKFAPLRAKEATERRRHAKPTGRK